MFDTGNALFRAEGLGDEFKARAAFIVQEMGKLGTQVMVAGARDLDLGAGFLKTEAGKAKLKVLSANLRDNGVAPFEPSTVITVDGIKVGFVGISPPGPVSLHPTLIGQSIVPAAKAELEKLKGKVDLLILLAAVKSADALELGQQLKGLPDLILQSGEVRGPVPPQLTDGGAFLIGSGQRGQQIAKVTLKLDGKGVFHDVGEARRDQQILDHLEIQMKQLEDRRNKITDPAVKKDFDRTYGEVSKRREEQKAKLAKTLGPGARTLDQEWIVLDPSKPDDPTLKAEVLVIEPTYAGSH